MSITSITILFIVLQSLITLGKVAAEVLLLDEEVTYYGEFALSTLTCVVYYFTLLPRGASPIVCWFLASIFSAICLIISWGLPKVLDYFFGWGEEDIPLPVTFPLLTAWILFLCFLPSGLGATIGIPQLFSGKITFFIVIALTQLITAALVLFISYYFEDEHATMAIDALFSIGMAVLIWSLLHEQTSRGQATFLTFIIIIAINIELIGILYFAAHYLEIGEIDDSFWKTRRYIFSSQLIAVVVIYFFPLLHGILSLIDKVIT
ncbi:hypothetical protein [Candidatus Uabimicrobium amorphum]|uniref:Uncharacterized protein n=1 Tax=Uabimicrobium amorphum TaxID=2596890 RepID=A0A5S9IRY1_UABAM|nr:hypothetical protein [Candidatus Uabimicrobium amorphum]BBM86804.1 hypothetical protein UABAM_05192 [Candidatus Uabimicrobium amorphum]